MASNIELMLKPELKTFLSVRGMTVTDYNVHQLRELARKAVELNLPVLKTPDNTTSSLEQRCRSVVDGRIINFPMIFSNELRHWIDDLTLLPILTAADIFAYLLSTSDWSPARLKGYKSERGYRLYKANHVHSVKCHELQHDHLYIKSLCVRETSQTCDPYRTWCLLNSECCVSAGCDCTGDDGGCKHVVALLFSLAHWSDRHVDRHTEACTDAKCTWDVPRKESKPKKLDDIEQSVENNKIQPLQHHYDPTVNQTNCDVDHMLLDLVKNFDTQIIEVLSTDANNNHYTSDPKSLKECFLTYNRDENVFDFIHSCISESDCTEINSLTEGQSESPEWFKYREGRITSSIMHNACRYKGCDPNNYVVKNIFNDCKPVSTPAVLYGKEREPLARSLYENDFAKKHKGGHVKTSGLIVNRTMPHLGASPDGIVHCKCCGKGVVEIKCPYKYKNYTLEQIFAENYYIEKDENGSMKLKENSNWYTQIQTQMAVSNAKWCDFVLYLEGDVKSGKHKIYSERILFDEKLWEGLNEKSKVFFQDFVLPRLLL